MKMLILKENIFAKKKTHVSFKQYFGMGLDSKKNYKMFTVHGAIIELMGKTMDVVLNGLNI